jgi:hypothetical protein
MSGDCLLIDFFWLGKGNLVGIGNLAGVIPKTNTRDEQERTYQAYIQQMEDERAKEYKRTAAGLKP